LLELGSPDDWKKARAELERFLSEGKIDAVHFSDVKRRLDAAILDPGIVTAATRDRAFQQEKSALYSVLIEANKARDTDSAKYLARFQEYLAGLERLRARYADSPSSGGMHDEIRNGYMGLAGYVRFVQKQPERAIGLYQKAAAMGATRAGEKSIWDVGGIDILLGDVYQFDLRNPAKALQHYELALDRVSKTQTEGSDIEKAFFGRQKNWLQHEIAYLKTGGTFAGTVERDDAFGVIGFAFLLGASDSAFGEPDTRALYKDPAWQTDRSKVDREKLREKMEQLPSSRVTLLKTIIPLSLLPTEGSILRYLKKHDPSGYLSACILGAVPYVDQVLKDPVDKDTADQMRAILPGLFIDAPQRGNAFRLASARFLKENRIGVHVAAADPRKSTPENTWKLFIESLRDGNLETAFSCLTGGMAAKLRPGFSQMPRQALRDIANSFSGFSVTMDMGNSREAAVTRGDRLGLIYFVLELGEWKIQEM
jgi:tetratricopeptide (TPR) repeat protein